MENEFFDKFMEFTAIIHGIWAGAGILITIFLTLGMWLFNTLTLMLGAKIANIDDRSFGKAFLATVLSIVLGGAIISVLAWISPLLALIGIILPCIFIQWVYTCSFGRALLAYILSLISSIVLYICVIIIIMFGLGAVLRDMPKFKETKTEEVRQIDKDSNTTNYQPSEFSRLIC